MPTTNPLLLTCALAVLITAGGCSNDAPETTPVAVDWLHAEERPDARPVGDVKADAAEGDTVVVLGRIGGRLDPITAESSTFTIVDLNVPHCGQKDHDTCPTPWDYCCEPRDALIAHSATVQLVDAEGVPIDTDPIAAGLKALDAVVIVGTVGPRPAPEVLTIRATAVHRSDAG